MIDTLIRTTALLALVTIATHLLRRRPAALRHMLWSLAIVGTVTMPALVRLTPSQYRIPLDLSTLVVPAAVVPDATPSRTSAPTTTPVRQLPAAGAATSTTAPAAPPSAVKNEPATSLGAPFDWVRAFVVLWLAGAAVLLMRLVVGLVTVQRIANRAREVTDANWRMVSDRAAAALDVRVPVEVRMSSEVEMPFACGLVRPIIVIPSSADAWGPQQRDAVLLHEFAHISRGDLAMNMLSHVTRALYWINPFAWYAAHKLRVEGERAADDAVLRGGARPSDYADHLLSIVREVGGSNVPKVALAMARRSDFEGRLLAILEPGVSRARLTRIRSAGLAALFLAAVMPLAAMTPKNKPEPEPEAKLELKAETGAPTATPTPTPTPTRAQEPAAPLPRASATVSALADALADAIPQVRLAAVNALGELQDPAAIAALARAMKEDTDARVREAAAWALGEIDDNRAVPHLLEALRVEKMAKVREKIVHSLAEIDDASAVGGVSAVLRDPAPEVRRAAVNALSEFEDPSASTALAGMIRDDDTEVRRRVAEALGQLEQPSAIEPLTTMVHDSDAEVRANAIESLHHFSEQQGMRLVPIFTAALKDSSSHVRQHAADALGNIEGLKKAPSALIDALSDPSRDVRHEAAQALGNIGDEAAVPGLKKLISESDPESRRAAVEAMKEIGGQEAITALMGLLKDPDPEVRKTAAEALGKRRGG